MKRTVAAVAVLLSACAVSTGNGFGNDKDAGKGSGGDSGSFGPGLDGGGMTSDGGGGGGAPVIYAHSDTELYSMDPTTEAITDLGTFDDGTTSTPVITDLAVDGQGEVWVNSESAIYKAAIGSGTVSLTKVSAIALKTNQKFYALGFAPAGVLGTAETLVAGDNLGVLYAIETNGQTTQLGSFGTDSSGNPYELSGDVVFYTQSGTARGLATVRSCQKGGSCSGTNDILAEIDVPAMSAAYASKTPAASLKKQFLGNGTGYGHLFGVGAWNDSVYAFARVSGTTPAQLVVVNGSGTGTVVKTFGQISAGWSGAGVTTKASITVLPN